MKYQRVYPDRNDKIPHVRTVHDVNTTSLRTRGVITYTRMWLHTYMYVYVYTRNTRYWYTAGITCVYIRPCLPCFIKTIIYTIVNHREDYTKSCTTFYDEYYPSDCVPVPTMRTVTKKVRRARSFYLFFHYSLKWEKKKKIRRSSVCYYSARIIRVHTALVYWMSIYIILEGIILLLYTCTTI